jgi:hypothetical protein
VQARGPTPPELTATSVVALDLSEVSAKCRSGPPIDDKPDMELLVWAGVLPFNQLTGLGQPVADPLLAPGLPVPPSVAGYKRPASQVL